MKIKLTQNALFYTTLGIMILLCILFITFPKKSENNVIYKKEKIEKNINCEYKIIYTLYNNNRYPIF